nr:hypothetical protein Iba_chr13cCG8030 [Ipomoea batatas]
MELIDSVEEHTAIDEDGNMIFEEHIDPATNDGSSSSPKASCGSSPTTSSACACGSSPSACAYGSSLGFGNAYGKTGKGNEQLNHSPAFYRQCKSNVVWWSTHRPQYAVGEVPQDAVGEELEPEEQEPIIPFQQAGVEAIHGLDGQGPKEVGKDIQDGMTNSVFYVWHFVFFAKNSVCSMCSCTHRPQYAVGGKCHKMLLGKSSKPEEQEPIIPFQQAGVESNSCQASPLFFGRPSGVWDPLGFARENLYSED